jgi:glycopeptide antibiotics resistance protein
VTPRARLGSVGLAAAAAVALLVAGGLVALEQPGVPYNVKELFQDRSPALTLGLLGAAWLLIGATPMALARRWVDRPLPFTWSGPLLGVGLALAVFGVVRLAVPLESIHDLVGAPVLGVPPELELAGRFVGLYLGVAAGMTIGVRLTLARFDRRAWPGLVVLVLAGLVSHGVVVEFACTDNIVELLRGQGDRGSALAVAAYLVLLGVVGGLWARAADRLMAGRRPVAPLAAAVAASGLALPAGWALFLWATNPRLEKYGQVFSAPQFLLSPDRQRYLDGWDLAARFSLAQAGATLALAVGMVLARRPTPAGGPRPARTAGGAGPGRPTAAAGVRPSIPPSWAHYLALASGFTALAIYGSLVPLRYTPVDLGTALRRFSGLPYLYLGIQSRSDLVANVLLFIPIGFCWAASLLVDRPGRTRAGVVAPLVALSCAALSVAVEFAQVWFPPRTVSQNDILAETAGGVLGVAAWLIAGRAATAWARSYMATRRRSRQVEWLLQAYLVGLLIYSFLPFDLTIAPHDLWRKYHEGRVVLVPFSSPRASVPLLAFDLVTDVLIFVPVGMLAASALTSRGRVTRPLGPAVLIGLALVSLIEAGQLLVYSRYTDTTDIVQGVAGIGLGAWLARRLWAGTEDARGAAGAGPLAATGIWIAAAALYALALVAVFWYPFDFIGQGPWARERLGAFVRVPFAALYAGTDLDAMMAVVRKVVWFAPLGSLCAIAATRSPCSAVGRRLGIAAGIVAAVAVALAIELGQVLLPDKVADLTDVLLCGGGAVAGALLTARLAAAAPSPRRPGPSAADASAASGEGHKRYRIRAVAPSARIHPREDRP